jgi:kumamolisin
LEIDPLKITPLNYNGSGPSGSYQGADFRNAYAPGSGLTGAGQVVAVAEFDGYYPGDIANYEAQCGYASVPLTNVLLNHVSGIPGYSHLANAVAEVSLDIELAIAMAPDLSQVIVYEGSNPYTVFNRIATDNLASQISCSWTFGVGPGYNLYGKNSTLDSILSELVAQGQAVFQASGDSDAYTGSQVLNSSTGPIPVDSPYVTSVGGTSLTMSGAGTAWASETVWNWGGNTGSGGGSSPNYSIPWWQTNASMAANGGSLTERNLPDVALTADAVYVIYNNGSSGYFGGTSCAAPLWAGFCALANQQALAWGCVTNSVGFLNPALYAIAASASYPACFHDITTGNNIGSYTAGLYYAANGYDLCTGLGTPNGTNLINILAPPIGIEAPPMSQTVTEGNCAVFTVAAFGLPPLSYLWQRNGTNIPGATGPSYSLCNVQPSDSGSQFTCIVSNGSGEQLSVSATLTVNFASNDTDAPLLPAWGTLVLFAGLLGAGAWFIQRMPNQVK